MRGIKLFIAFSVFWLVLAQNFEQNGALLPVFLPVRMPAENTHDDLLNDEMFDLPEDPDAEKVFAELDATEGELVNTELELAREALMGSLLEAENSSQELHVLQMHLENEGQPQVVVDDVIAKEEDALAADETDEDDSEWRNAA